MKTLKKISLIISMLAMVFVISGCSNTEEEKPMNNFILKYESEKEVDKVIFVIDGYEGDLEPMHEDKKVKKGYSNNVDASEEKDVEYSIQVIDNDKVIYEIENQKIDLSEEKMGEVSIVDKGNGKLGIDVNVK